MPTSRTCGAQWSIFGTWHRRLGGTLAAALLSAFLPLGAHPPADAATAQLQLRGTFAVTYGSVLGKATDEAFSTAAVGDVTGDGVPDVVVGGTDGHVRGWTVDGRLFLDHVLPGPGAVLASPTLVDLDGDGVLDVLAANDAGYVDVVTGDGRLAFRRRDCTAGRDQGICGVFATPVAGDIDRDGRPEIVVASWDHHVYAWNHDGTQVPGFPRYLLDTLWSSPTLADLDGDGRLEIVLGGDMDADYPGQPYPAGGLLWVLRHDGTIQPGFPRSLPGQTIWSSPAVVDVSGDGLLDIVVGTGLQFPAPAGARVHAVDRAGRDLPGWPVTTDGRVMGSPAVGDVDGDGRYEVAVLSEGGWISVFRAGGGTPLWKRCNRTDTRTCDGTAPIHGSPSIADIDGDGDQEVVNAAEHRLRAFDGATGAPEAEVLLGGDVFAPAAAPTVALVGTETWVVQHATRNTNADGRRGPGDTQTVFVFGTGQPLRADDWPTFRQNPQRIASIVGGGPAPAACPRDRVPEDGFADVLATNLHERSVDCVAWWQVAAGISPTQFAPVRRVTRGQMATFIVRAVEAAGDPLPPGPDRFPDDEGNAHEPNIDKAAEAGIVSGRADGTFGPDEPVTRAQMATFLVRAAEHVLGQSLATGPDAFTDDEGNPHEPNIDKAAGSGIASGVGGGRYAPNRLVVRDQMASFLARMLGVLVDRGDATVPAP